ncbi:MAG: AEC family transporter [Spirochaetales bacterium]|nr:AEC family transporter [Spirochaetales bacterium]
MENLLFSLNSTMPIFLMMLLGLFFRKVGIIDEVLATKMNKFVFTIPLPFVLFRNLATVDFKAAWDFPFVAFCFVATLLSIVIVTIVSFLFHDRSIQGEFIQASYRSSAAILGVAFIQNMYGDSGMGPLMIIGSVPLYNVVAMTVLSFFGPNSTGFSRENLKRTVIGIVKNPILVGIACGLVWSALGIPLKGIPYKTISNIAATATPLGIMAMGASFDFRKINGKIAPAIVASLFKLVFLVAIFVPRAYLAGFRRAEMVAILVMLGSATTVSAYVMAKSMGHEGTVSSSTVMITTLFSAFTLTFWIFILRSLGII